MADGLARQNPGAPRGGPEGAIPVFRPYLGPEVHEAASEALSIGWLGAGAATALFENELAMYLGLEGRHLVAMSSCTASLHTAFLVAGIGAGDEVVCPSFTYVAGHQAVSMTGGEVVFCDIDERTLAVDPDSLRSAIGERTKAVMVVHYGGPPADLDPIYEIAGEHDLRVIEDAAHAFGTKYRGRPIGSFGDLTCFSFGPVKIITSLEGGAIVTPNPRDVQLLQELRLVGVTGDTIQRHRDQRTWEYDVVRQGYRYHLGAVPATIGLSQLRMIETFVENRQRYCRRYSEAFADLPEVQTPASDFSDVGAFIYFVRVRDEPTRRSLMAHLRDRGVGTGIHFLGAHRFNFYRGCRRTDLSVTERVSDQIVTLPLWSFMDEVTLARVIDGVRSFFRA